MKHELNANIAPEKATVPLWLKAVTLLWVAAVAIVLIIQLITGTTFLAGAYTVYDFIADGGTLLIAAYIFFAMKRYKLYAGLAALVVVTAGVFALAEVPNNHSAWHSQPYHLAANGYPVVAVVQQNKSAISVYLGSVWIDNLPLCTVPLPEDFAYLDFSFDPNPADGSSCYVLTLYDETEEVLSVTSVPRVSY